MASLLSFARRPAVERRLLIRAVALLTLTRIGLRLSSVSRVEAALARLPSAPAAAGASATIEQVRWAVRRASRFVPRATCLPQALVARSLLERHGFPASVHIGVTRDDGGGLRAHAWTSADGRIVVGGIGVERYEVLAELGRRGGVA